MKTIFRLALVEWRDQYNTDTYYLSDLMKTTNFQSEQKARKWVEKHIEKIKKLVDCDYTSDLYIEKWNDEWCVNESLIMNLYTRKETQ